MNAMELPCHICTGRENDTCAGLPDLFGPRLPSPTSWQVRLAGYGVGLRQEATRW